MVSERCFEIRNAMSAAIAIGCAAGPSHTWTVQAVKDLTGQGPMKHATSQFLFGYWDEIRDGRLAPKRFEIEPARMGSILPDTFILERSGINNFTFRLTGTRITERFKADLRHVGFADIWTDHDRKDVLDIVDNIKSRGGVGRIESIVQDDDGRTASVEYLILPLIHTRHSVDRMVGAMSVLSVEDASWLGDTPITSQEIATHETIWPEGSPQAVADIGPGERPALAPHVRTARIVRVDRRQFRVYDGGRKSEPQS